VTPAEYNRRALAQGTLTVDHIAQLVRSYQLSRGLQPDGKAGARTLRALDLERGGHDELAVVQHLLSGSGVDPILAHPSWYSGPMPDGPLAIAVHYTATRPGTARSLHERRLKRRVPVVQRNTSWHITIAADGAVYQMVPLDHMARHCERGAIAGQRPNACSIGIELEGHGDVFPEAQVAAACRVWRVLVREYSIPRSLAMIGHSDLDPEHRSDPGPVWTSEHAARVLEHAFAEVNQ
jgi:hypothetical protein